MLRRHGTGIAPDRPSAWPESIDCRRMPLVCTMLLDANVTRFPAPVDNRGCFGPNVVLPSMQGGRFGPGNAALRRNLPPLRRYSLRNFSLRSDAPICASVDALVKAAAAGRYDGSGAFVTDCTIPTRSNLPRLPCVRVFGDSTTRHMLQTASMVLKDDFVSGGFVEPNPACVCDGQLSEHKMCRNQSLIAYPFPCRSAWYDSHLSCETRCASSRPRFVWLQGGFHHKLNATRFAAEIHREAKRLKRGGDALFVSGAHFQTADADRVFPWQRRERVVEFNREARVAAEAAGGRFVDLAPATEGARATSDGVHYLTAVNLVKARIFIALLHMSHDI